MDESEKEKLKQAISSDLKSVGVIAACVLIIIWVLSLN